MNKNESLNPILKCNGECHKCEDNIPPRDTTPNLCGRLQYQLKKQLKIIDKLRKKGILEKITQSYFNNNTDSKSIMEKIEEFNRDNENHNNKKELG